LLLQLEGATALQRRCRGQHAAVAAPKIAPIWGYQVAKNWWSYQN
jgi:hypothetical protein